MYFLIHFQRGPGESVLRTIQWEDADVQQLFTHDLYDVKPQRRYAGAPDDARTIQLLIDH